jgi:glutamate dehydrogenase/leucine dehydrogenase
MRLQTSLGIAIGTALGTLIAARALRSRRAIDFTGKTVAIFGGSRGLGLAMAREFSNAGAHFFTSSLSVSTSRPSFRMPTCLMERTS